MIDLGTILWLVASFGFLFAAAVPCWAPARTRS